MLLAALLSALTNVGTTWAADPVVIKWWHHPADAENIKLVMREVARRYEAAYPSRKVELTWYQKKEMFPAIRSAVLAGQGPDLFYFDIDVPEFITSGMLADISDGVDWTKIEPWAKQYWNMKGPGGKSGIWAFPIGASTDELYYNKALLRELGISVPDNNQFNQDQFVDLVKRCVAAGKSAFAVGTGDRPYPGAYITNYLLLSKLGEADLADLWSGGGKVTWRDPRVQEVLAFHKRLIDMKAYPANVSSMKLGEAHRYFHTEQRACLMPVGSWYTFRAFLPPEAGGQPKSFELGMLNYPVLPDGKGVKAKFSSLAVSLAVNARTSKLKEVQDLLNVAASPDIGALWMAKTASPSTIMTGNAVVESEFGDYVAMLSSLNRGAALTTLSPSAAMPPAMADAYVQIINSAFPAGLLSVEEATTRLENIRLKGR